MLDNSDVDTLAAEDGQDTLIAEGEDTLAAEEPGEVVIAIEGEEVEADPDADPEISEDEYEALGDKGKAALRKLKDALKAQRIQKAEAKAEAREAKARVAEIEASGKPKEPDLKRPTLEDCGFNEDVFAEKMAAFVVADDKRKADEAATKAAEKADSDAYEAKRQTYFAERAKVGVDDETEARVVSKLNGAQQTVLMDVCADPAKVVAALAKTPKVLEELAGIKQVHKFAHRLAQIEGKITVTTKTPPPPETKLRGGGPTADAVSTVPLDKLKARADASGDYTQYFAEKRRRAEAGVKT